MGILTEFGFTSINHLLPLHYLPYIARSGVLLSKPALRERGFAPTHFRSMSKNHDELRGFADYVHLTLHPEPPILRAKLAGGFPHVRLEIPAHSIENACYDLCRFNVAMTRYLRRDGKPGHEPSETNGRYYDQLQVPVARTDSDKRGMLGAWRSGDMIEVLVPHQVALPIDVRVHCYSSHDMQIASAVLQHVRRPWRVDSHPDAYRSNPAYVTDVTKYIEHALKDSNWKGDGLEFDRI